MSFVHAIREVSCEWGFARVSQQPVACALPAYPPPPGSRRLPMFPIASTVTATWACDWRKHPVIAMPVFPRRRDEIGHTIEELKRREVDDAIGPGTVLLGELSP